MPYEVDVKEEKYTVELTSRELDYLINSVGVVVDLQKRFSSRYEDSGPFFDLLKKLKEAKDSKS